MRPITTALVGAAISLSAVLASPALATPPVAPVRDQPETLHGVTVSDPYRYFESVKDPQVQTWLQGQGAHARKTLDRIEGRDAMQARIAQLASATGDRLTDIVRMPGARLYYLKRGGRDAQFKLVLRQGIAGQEHVLVDPQVDIKRTGVPHSVDFFVPSWDGRYVAYGMSAGGSENASLHILHVASGRQLIEPIPRVHQGLVHWLPDSRSLTYNQFKQLKSGESETETYMDSKVMWLQIGHSAAQARAVFGPTVRPDLGLARLDVAGIQFTPGSPWMIARTTDTTLPEGSLFVAPVTDIGQRQIGWKQISKFDDKIVDIALKGQHLYYRTHAGAPQYKLMRLDLRRPVLTQAQLVALPPKDTVLEGFHLTRDSLVVSVREGTSIGLRRHGGRDTVGRAIPLPYAGAAQPHDDPAHAHDDLLFTLGGWTRTPETFQLRDMQVSPSALRAKVQLPPMPNIEVVQAMVPSHDGVRVPMTILHKKGLALDGSNPTLLDGYGAYGASTTAHFNPAAMVWLERGGVLAYANVRGSGVYGEPWRMAGFKATKSNTWRDGIACAKYLIAQGYATPKTMGIYGGSAGGIFAGRSVTSEPSLFAAAIFDVGVMDAVRAEESANGATNISEFGSYKNSKEFPALLEMR